MAKTLDAQWGDLFEPIDAFIERVKKEHPEAADDLDEAYDDMTPGFEAVDEVLDAIDKGEYDE